MASWFDLMVGEEERKTDAYVRMTASQWRLAAQQIIRTWTGDLRFCLNYLDDIDAKRAAVATAPQPAPVPISEDERNWRVWMDMVEEPEKYGSDIGEWIALDEEVRRGPKRWRVDAYWNGKLRQIEEQEAAAATKIQALWRGYQTRYEVEPQFTCAHCLARGLVSRGDDYDGLCLECVNALQTKRCELWGPEEDDGVEICGDCGDEVIMYGAQVGDLYLCPECVHDWTVCTRCDGAIRYGARCDNHCLDCGDTLSDTCSGAFCCGDCRTNYIRESWRDQR